MGKILSWEEYNEPHYDLVVEAIENKEVIDGDILASFLCWNKLEIIEVDFGRISQDNFNRKEIDRYTVFKVKDKNYLVWSYIDMKTLEKYYPTQTAEEVKRTKREINEWNFVEEE